MAESFASLLKRHRVAAGLSQETLAERAGVSVDAISYLERDSQHAPQKATLNLLIAALALDDDSRRQIEEAAKHARARGPQPQLPPNNNLPPQLTSFVDRESAVAEIKEKLQSYRLVTVVGSGGVGKSRCAIELAADMLGGFGDGVWLAELAPISDPLLVCTVVARALSVQEAPHRPLLDTLLAYLKRKQLLLILDNCEHVIEEARHFVAAILRGCPDVRILATSRESLSIAGEHAYRMPSLPVPSPSELLSIDEMWQCGAVQLFSDRALSADNRYALTAETAPHVADICRRLDGIPLAIELAAARVKVLSPHELAQKLNERFRLLTAGDRSALPRHRTMRALIDWSYDLLSNDERMLLRKLSIFAGGFSLKTAADVCSDGAIDEIVVLDLLSSLVDKSLVQPEVMERDTRYRLLESTRQYAREKLRDAGEEDAVERAHVRAFVALAEQLDAAYETASDRELYAQLESELENFRAALAWAFGARGDVLLGQRLAIALRRVQRSFGVAAGRWVQVAQQRVTPDTPIAVQASLDLAEARSASDLTQHKASLCAAERALARYRELTDPRGIAEAEILSGRAQIMLGEVAEGETLTGRVLESLPVGSARRSVMVALENLALARSDAGDLPGARQRFREALILAQAIGAERSTAGIAINLAEAEFRGGDALAALRLTDEALAVLRGLGDTRPDVATAKNNMAAYLVALRRYNEARTAARDATTAARDLQWSVGLALSLQHLAAIAALRENNDVSAIEGRSRAARILGYADARLSELEAVREYTEQQEYAALLPALRDALGEDQLAQLMSEGTTWSEDQAVAEAMLI